MRDVKLRSIRDKTNKWLNDHNFNYAFEITIKDEYYMLELIGRAQFYESIKINHFDSDSNRIRSFVSKSIVSSLKYEVSLWS